MQRRALLSVSDKTGIVDLGRDLVARGWQLLSTGGTAAALRDAGVAVTEVADITRHPEMMDGRVKTLHPAIHAGLLARRDHPRDLEELAEQGYGPIDLVAVNLYPFRETVADPSTTLAQAMSKTDIGGPTMIRSAAKNHGGVYVVVDPADYGRVVAAIDAADADADAALRRELAGKVFRHTSIYDGAIADFLQSGRGVEGAPASTSVVAGDEAESRPPLEIRTREGTVLRYGENPDQEAAFYPFAGADEGIAALQQHHGKALSYNNLLDLDGALLSLAPFAFSPRPAVCIVKHTTPCGLGVGETLVEAYGRALACDPVSAFGSIIAVNRDVDAAAAEEMSKLFIECVVAPGFSPEAMEILTRKKNVRIMSAPALADAVDGEPSEWWPGADERQKGTARFLAAHARRPRSESIRSIYGGLLVQSPSPIPFYRGTNPGWDVVTERAPTEQEWDDLTFAWGAVYGVKSNAILLARDGATIGIGAGQMSRVDSSKIAVRKAGDAGLEIAGAALASDAFFPFRDGVDAAAEAGVRAIVQPGGSVRDDEVIAAANEHGIAMVFTARRLFRH